MSVINPTCPTGCSSFLPVPKFDECDPSVKIGEIRKIYIAALDATSFTDWSDAAEWALRISNTDIADIDTVRELTVSADMPIPAFDTIELTAKRKFMSPATYTINSTIDDNTDENYELMRWTKCNTRVRMWYATDDSLYGGETGIVCDVNMDEVIERGNKSLTTIQGTFTWEAKYAPERIANPLT